MVSMEHNIDPNFKKEEIAGLQGSQTKKYTSWHRHKGFQTIPTAKTPAMFVWFQK